MRQPQPRDQEVNDLCYAVAAEVVDDVEHPDAPVFGQLIGDEVDRPAFIDTRRH
jgi:hypothetical protein